MTCGRALPKRACFRLPKNESCIKIFLHRFFFVSCGLETLYYLLPPINALSPPRYDTILPEAKVFQFTIQAQTGVSGVAFEVLGTQIYYCIYKQWKKIDSVASSMSSLNNSSTSNFEAAERLKNSYNYKVMWFQNGSSPSKLVFPDTTANIRICLMKFASDPAEIIQNGGASMGIPIRFEGKDDFDFWKNADSEPKNGDSDFEDAPSFSSGYENTYFVDLYAATIGIDETLREYSSAVLHLGTVAISKP